MTGDPQGGQASPVAAAGAAPPPGGAAAAAGASGPRRRHPALGLLRLLFGLALQALLFVLLLLLLVLGTQTGLRTALSIAQELAPGLIRVGTVEGRILGRLHLEDLEVHAPGLDLAVRRFDLAWSPATLLQGTLRIERIAASDIDVSLAPATKEGQAPIALPELALPLRIELGEALVERLRVREPGAETPQFVLDRAALSASIEGSELKLSRLELDLPEPRLAARAQGQARLAEGWPLGLDLDWTLELPPAARLTGKGRIGGDLKRLVVEHEVTGSARVRLDAQVNDPLAQPSWDGRVELQGLDLPDFAADAPRLALTGRIETRGDPAAARLQGTMDGLASDLPDFGHLEADLDLQWQDRVLKIRELKVRESISGAALTGGGNLDLSRPGGETLAFKADWERLRWPLAGEPQAESAKGALEVSGTFDAFEYRLSTTARGPGLPAAELGLKGQGDRQGTRLGELELKTLGGRVLAEGHLAWAPEPAWDLRLRGEGLNPAGLAPGIEDSIGIVLDTKGSVGGYGYDLALTSQGPGLPPARLALGGKGDLKGTDIETLRLEALKGLVEGRARVGWDPKPSWEATLEARDLDPGAFAPDWPGQIGGRLASQGTLDADGPRLDLRIEGLEGQLRGYPVAASGLMHLAGQAVRIEGLKASSGPSQALVDGSVAPQALDLRFELSSPDLASLVPQAKGGIEAKGRVGGTPEAPEVKLELSAREAELAGQRIARLSGTADLALTPKGPFALRLDGEGLAVGGQAFDTLSLRGEGDMGRHTLSATLSGAELSTRLEANGALAADRSYRGSLTRLELDQRALGAWRLQKPMAIGLAGPRIEARPLCLRNAQGSGGCLGFEQTEVGRWAADLDLDKLGPELVQGLLPAGQTVQGGARVKGRFQAAGPVLTGGAVAEIKEGRIRLRAPGGKEQVLEVSGSRLSLDSSDKGLSARLGLPVKGLGKVDGDLSLPGWRLDNPARPDQPLQGGLRAQVDGLARVSNLVPDLTNATGTIDADLKLGGTLARPGIQGRANAKGLGAEVPLLGLKVAGLDLNLVADERGADLQGQGTVGGGRLELSGDYRQASGTGLIRAAGERLKVADTKEYFAVVSPRFEIRFEPKLVRVTGEILVPEARIRPRSLPAGTVSASSDVVMADRARARAQGGGLPIDIDLGLKLGEDVTIDAFGVRGRLAGDLRVLQAPGKEMLGDGQLQIVDGFYRLSGGFGLAAELGAPLTIEQGRLIYAKSPIANPGLLLQAQREGGDTTAGVRVLGTIRNPKLAFFSESDPDMSQAEITKYLLTGVPPKREGANENRSLSVGTYVAPKLYMEYENGLSGQKDKVKLRYDLSRHLELQTETGEGQGGDIFYKFEN